MARVIGTSDPDEPTSTSFEPVLVTTVAVSVIPYPWPTRQPGNARSTASCVSAPSGAAPVYTLRTLPRSYRLHWSALRRSAITIGGT